MDKYIAAAKAFWETFRNSWEAFMGYVSGKDAPLFGFIKDLISKTLGLDTDAAASDAEEEE
ncbi:MAG: hypothetical protein IJU56_09005 [Clostridia bacterium]|nr:hypothetical protein [Clostridia bacterium]